MELTIVKKNTYSLISICLILIKQYAIRAVVKLVAFNPLITIVSSLCRHTSYLNFLGKVYL